MQEDTDIAIGISYSVQVGDGRALVLQTHCPLSASIEQLHEALDKLRAASDRQAVFGKLEQLDLELERNQKMQKDCSENILLLDEKGEQLKQQAPNGHRPLKLKAADEAARDNALMSLKMIRKQGEELIQRRDRLQEAAQ